MITHTLARTVLAFGCLFALASAGYAGDVVYHGSLCNPQAGHVSRVNYNQWGAHNASTSGAAVVNCGSATPILSTIKTVDVLVYDRNPSANVSCTLMLTDIFGNMLWTDNRSSSGSSAGFQLLKFNPGKATHTVNLQCSLPAVTASGVSHIATYRVITP